MKEFKLNVTERELPRQKNPRALRAAGILPAVLYGPGTAPAHLTVDTKSLQDLTRKGPVGQMLIDLVFEDGGKPRKVMIKELQAHPVSGNLIHVDFYEVAMDREISVNVPIVVKGKAAGVDAGGTLQIIRRELEVACLPGNIPELFEIDVSALEIGDAFHVEEVEAPEGVRIPHDVNFTIITVVGATTEEKPDEEDVGGEEGAETAEETATAEAAGESGS